MYFAHTALTAACFIILVNGEGESDVPIERNGAENDDYDAGNIALIDNHTFVALIDIVFTDGSKRTCTGSIIHENVIITAAHCFIVEDKYNVKPELTTSFAVIGTKTMFDTGYEQYLPIERVLTHPKYKGWTADLSLVYTFAGMTSDKPGTIIPLAGEKTSTHVDSNVTVLSWGRVTRKDEKNSFEQMQMPPITQQQHDHDDEPCYSEEQEYFENEESKKRSTKKKRVTVSLQKKLRKAHGMFNDQSSFYSRERARNEGKKERQRNSKHRIQRSKSEGFESSVLQKIEHLRSKLSETQTTSDFNLYYSDIEQDEKISEFESGADVDNTTRKSQARRHRKSKRRHREQPTRTIKTTVTRRKITKPKKTTQSHLELFEKKSKVKQKSTEPPALPQIFNFKSYYKNWRRQMGTQQNQLTVENFGFVNIQACKLFVEKAMTSEYDISKTNDVVCYASGNRYINDDDSGAPAIRQGALVAVTVGGAECDGDHVAIGMKMSCYCSWIADNLPSGKEDLNCCKNCCDIKHKEELKSERRYKFKNKHL